MVVVLFATRETNPHLACNNFASRNTYKYHHSQTNKQTNKQTTSTLEGVFCESLVALIALGSLSVIFIPSIKRTMDVVHNVNLTKRAVPYRIVSYLIVLCRALFFPSHSIAFHFVSALTNQTHCILALHRP